SGNLYDLGNANQWKSKAVANGYTVDSNPATGAVAWYDAHSWNGGYGHVAWVEKVNSQSSIIVEEYNWNLDGTYNPSPVTVPSSTQTVWPDGFIHFKDIPNDPTPPTISWNFENLEGGTNPTPVSSYQGNVGH